MKGMDEWKWKGSRIHRVEKNKHLENKTWIHFKAYLLNI